MLLEILKYSDMITSRFKYTVVVLLFPTLRTKGSICLLYAIQIYTSIYVHLHLRSTLANT